jgi:hypothetical protein
MGAELAVHNEQSLQIGLHNFADFPVTLFELDVGAWVIFGRAIVYNGDGDGQWVSAKIITTDMPASPGAPGPPPTVTIDHVRLYADADTRHCLAAQATLKLRDRKVVSLMCNTFKGEATFGSLIAIKVDDITP